ncbi:hypothetical protein [Tenacibaculum agarivorans]|uniref:hypothetical protein n=1 Tax=Tenacibaculum agarivorans TaxID=1908389 RepID=UPI00094B83D0|nr:hypothetical protein [Tenacibaculum agarivorans]
MKSNYNSIKFKQWLDKLQQESWQLELLISGFAIFGLANVFEPLRNKITEANAMESPYEILYGLVYSYSAILAINLVVHVIFRGLWIGSVGLRYVSGDIDYEKLNYTDKFTKYLKKKVGPFDKYISNLEDLCSIVFAMSFIVLFYFLAFFICSTLPILILKQLQGTEILPKLLFKIISGFVLLVFYVSALLFFIDFLTQGYLKKKKWISKIYFPIYVFFSTITLSFLYRALIYNFLDNKFGKRVLLLLMPIYIVVGVLSSFKNTSSNYLLDDSFSSANYIEKSNYLNTIDEKSFVKDIAIQHKVITDSYLKVFIVYKSEIEDIITQKNASLKPKKDSRGYKQTVFTASRRDLKKLDRADSLYRPYLKTFNKIYSLKIDSIEIPSDFIISKVNKQLGFETILPLKSIPEGKHLLKVSRINYTEKDKKEITEKVIDIPFWYYKD